MNQDILRKLARSTKYQLLYNRAKEMTGICLFKNITDFSDIQILFLYWLEVYSSLYLDLACKEDYISEKVIEDNIRTDAYLMWKHQKKDKKDKKKEKESSSNLPKVVFTESVN